MRRTRTLTARAVLSGCAVAVVSVLVTVLISVPVTVRSVDRDARQALTAQARLTAEVLRPRLDRGRTADEERVIRQLRNQGVDAYLIRAGQADRPGLPSQVVDRVAGGRNFTGRRAVSGEWSIVVGRALPGGNGVVLAQPATRGVWLRVLRGLWLPLLAGLLAGAVAGALLARRLARPIRNAAAAAARLRAGDRGVRVPVESPQEAADLAYALNDLAAALDTSEGRQREFLLSVSHELRTPLTAIRGYAEALADGVVAGDGAQRAGQTMLAEAQHLDRLVGDLLALARLEAADFPLHPVPVDLAALVRDAAEAWRPRCEAAGIELRVEATVSARRPQTAQSVGSEATRATAVYRAASERASDPSEARASDSDGEIPAHTDPGRIRQVVDGLLENALRVLPAGAPLVVAARPHGVVEVRDGGPGFTDDDLAVAFERGALRQRYEGVRKVGSGLGLALAAGLVRRLGGTIEAGHAAEGGARFTVTLPSYETRTSA
jgi:signal transduction histidine kinase